MYFDRLNERYLSPTFRVHLSAPVRKICGGDQHTDTASAHERGQEVSSRWCNTHPPSFFHSHHASSAQEATQVISFEDKKFEVFFLRTTSSIPSRRFRVFLPSQQFFSFDDSSVWRIGSWLRG